MVSTAFMLENSLSDDEAQEGLYPEEVTMTVRLTASAFILAAPLTASAFAQTVGSEVQRDINQENRIEQGLKSGQLSTGEAARLEKGEARIDKMESKAAKDGTLSPQEDARIPRAQYQESAAINRANITP